ncbi:MAG: serine--tRNA ligase, partial [Bdellovibrionaceae bacterium]|nr:serine--tRNA ligase [Pseudobdellovibrionaceae bacterium]
MLDLKDLEGRGERGPDFVESYKKTLINRGYTLETLNKILNLSESRRSAITAAEQKRALQNQLSQQIPQLKKEGKDISQLREELSVLAAEVKKLQADAEGIDSQIRELLLTLPNHLHSSVPVGNGSKDNVIVKTWGEPRRFGFPVKDHHQLGETLGIIDFQRAGKVSGSRFAFLNGWGARLELALIQFFMDIHGRLHGYREMIPPYFVNTKSYYGTGQFPKFYDDVFHAQGFDLHLISTAEVPVTNYYQDEILSEKDLPQRFCAFSPCFRSEAGSHGRDTRGIFRQHQFHKVELMIFSLPDESYDWHEKLTRHAEVILEQLELPYRRVLLCSGDIGFGAAKCYDLEVWLPGVQEYREISSCSNFEDFQSRRANIRYRDGKGNLRFVHTLNGSGLAVGRTFIAILENYQNEDGSVTI